ncbi:MAG: hypothetical protein KatS3mg068_2658 [Candidatus Sericytochromatia bacterium]|nr:MAG: hypothetical protein KatS3mg068_2658 [Candidatus Sericytochromatia bacterium]
MKRVKQELMLKRVIYKMLSEGIIFYNTLYELDDLAEKITFYASVYYNKRITYNLVKQFILKIFNKTNLGINELYSQELYYISQSDLNAN